MLVRLASLILLLACAPSGRLQPSYVHQTDTWQTVSHDAEVFRDGGDHMLARLVILEHAGAVRYYLSLSFLHGRSTGPQILSVTHGGKKLDYVRHDRLRAFCIDHCHKAEVGQIRLTQNQLFTAAKAGMTLQIDGLRRNYTAQVPAQLFSSAMNAAHQREPTHNPLPR